MFIVSIEVTDSRGEVWVPNQEIEWWGEGFFLLRVEAIIWMLVEKTLGEAKHAEEEISATSYSLINILDDLWDPDSVQENLLPPLGFTQAISLSLQGAIYNFQINVSQENEAWMWWSECPLVSLSPKDPNPRILLSPPTSGVQKEPGKVVIGEEIEEIEINRIGIFTEPA